MVDMEKAAENQEKQTIPGIQETFLNAARKDRLNVTIYLVSGVKLSGRIRSFDKYALVLESGNQEQLIYKQQQAPEKPSDRSRTIS